MSIIKKYKSIVLGDVDSPQKEFVFYCLHEDIDELPELMVGTGSIALVVDTSEIYIFHEDEGWLKWGGE